MNTPSFSTMIARLFSGFPLLERIDLVVEAAQSGGLQVTEIALAPDDFETFRDEAATHLLVSIGSDHGRYRGHAVRREGGGVSHVDVLEPGGRGSRLPICLRGQ